MSGFFLMIAGILFLMFQGLSVLGGRGYSWLIMMGEAIEYAEKKGYDVAYKTYYSHLHKDFVYRAIDLKTKKRVMPKRDKNGIARWYYMDDGSTICSHSNNQILVDNAGEVKLKAMSEGKQWYTIPNFWDCRLSNNKNHSYQYVNRPPYYLDNYQDCFNKPFKELNCDEKRWDNNYGIHTYSTGYTRRTEKELEQYFSDNAFTNQKVYLKNNRAYELHAGRLLDRSYNYIQYFIRFAKKDFDYTSVHMYDEKWHDEYWTKWYAITEEQYRKLSNQRMSDMFWTAMGEGNFQKEINRKSNVALNEHIIEQDILKRQKFVDTILKRKKEGKGLLIIEHDILNKDNPYEIEYIKYEELIWAFDKNGNFVED